MNRLDSEEASFSDADVEPLLQEFFRAEMPAEFRRPAAVPQPASLTVPRRSAAKPETTAAASAAALLAIVATLLITVLALHRPMNDQLTPRDITAVDAPTAAAPASVADASSVEKPAEPLIAEERVGTVEQRIYDTEDGPVEQRKFWKWIDLEYIEPETGEKVEWLLPELNIEIIPIEEEEEQPETSSEEK